MEEFFAVKAATNDRMVCIGPLSHSEESDASDAGFDKGTGLFIYLADSSQAGRSVEVLAKVASDEAARVLGSLLGFSAPIAV